MRVVSWNIEGRLSRYAEAGRRGSPEGVLRHIEKLDGDIIVLPEAYDGENPIEPEIRHHLEKQLGYKTLEVNYCDSGNRQYAAVADPHMMLLSRFEVKRFNERRLGGVRNSIMADIVAADGEIIRLHGIHLDDRKEANRLKQVDELISIINQSPYPVLALGDFNAMPMESIPARLLRNKLILLAIEQLPHQRTKDILSRLSEMAIGETIQRLQSETTLVSANIENRLTTTPKMRDQEWMPSIPMAEIDHILVSPGIEVDGFRVSRDGGSDHRAISTTIRATGQT